MSGEVTGKASADRGRAVLLALWGAGLVLLNFPMLTLWGQAVTVFALPLLPVALFAIWAALIGALALASERGARGAAEGGEREDAAARPGAGG